MEEKYKLKELKTDNIFSIKKVKIFLFTIWLVSVLILSILIFIATKSIGATLLMAFSESCILGIFALSIYLYPKNNREYEYIKNIGKKDFAYM